MNDDPGLRRPALVLDASHRQSLVAVRSLGRAGIEVWAAENRGRVAASVSRWCAGRAVLPDVNTDGDAFVDGVIELCKSLGNPVVISCHDGSIEALRARRAEVEQVGMLALASDRALSSAVNKQGTLSAAQRVGIPVPLTFRVTDISAARDAIGELGLPVVVKPEASWVIDGSGGWGTGPAVSQTTGEALGQVEHLVDGGVAGLIQPWLAGVRDAVSIFLVGEEVRASFAVRASRMSPMIGGDAVIRETIPMPSDVGPMAVKLVRELHLEGYGEVEFRRDATGRPFLMEVNPRLNAGVEVAVRAGVDVPHLLYRWAAGEPVTESLEYRVGFRMRWLHGDLQWLAEALLEPDHPDSPGRRAAVVEFLAEFGRPASYDYWDAGDVRPAVREATRVASLALQRIGLRSNGRPRPVR